MFPAHHFVMATFQVCPTSPPLNRRRTDLHFDRGYTHHICKSVVNSETELGRLNRRLNNTSSCDALVSAIKHCGQNKLLQEGKKVHAQIIEAGYGGDVFLGNCLLEMYGQCGSLTDAKDAFDNIPFPNTYSWNLLIRVYADNGDIDGARYFFSSMPKPDVISWSTIISAYASHGKADKALEFYDYMHSVGVKANDVTFLSVLDACSSPLDLGRGCSLHATILECGYSGDIVIDTALVNMYGKCGDLGSALNIFHCMQFGDMIAWNAIILACSKNRDSGKALQLYSQMQLGKVLRTKATYLCALDACNSPNYIENAYEIHTDACEQGLDENVMVGTALTQAYGKCGCLDSAKTVFSQMPQHTTLSWNTMIATCTGCGNDTEALRIFYQMYLDGIKPDISTFTSILDACSTSLLLEEGRCIHSLICESKHDEDEAVGNALINMYGRCSSVKDARETFAKLQNKSLITWTAMMTAFSQNGYGYSALALFKKLKHEGFKPDKTTFLCALDACICASALKTGSAIHALLVNAGYESDLIVKTALINMYAKCGSLDDSSKMFNRISEHDVFCWNTMLAASAWNGHHSQTLEIFQKMHLEGVKPDHVTFFFVLIACIHTGKVDEGREQLHLMIQKYGFEQTKEHLSCMVDLLGRAGNLGEASALINIMSSEEVEVGLSSFLAACDIHGEQDVAAVAAQQMVEL